MGAVPLLQEARSLADRRQWQALVERTAALPDDALAAEPELAFLHADACRRVGQTLRSLEVAERVEPLVRRRGERHLLLNVTNLLGMALFEAGRIEEARRRFEKLLEDATVWGDEEFAARASNNLGVIANVQGRRDQALTCYRHALVAYQRLGFLRGLAQTHHNLGISYRDLGFPREADTHYRHAIDLGQADGSEDVVALAELERAMLRVGAGDGRLATALARRARQRFRRLQDPLGRAEVLRVMAAAARVSGRERLAERRLEAALAVARTQPDPLLRAEVQRDRGLLLRDLGHQAAARLALLDAAAHYDQLGARAEAEAVRALLDGLGGPGPGERAS